MTKKGTFANDTESKDMCRVGAVVDPTLGGATLNTLRNMAERLSADKSIVVSKQHVPNNLMSFYSTITI